MCVLFGRQEHEISFFLLLDENSGYFPRRSCFSSCQLRKVNFIMFFHESAVCWMDCMVACEVATELPRAMGGRTCLGSEGHAPALS